MLYRSSTGIILREFIQRILVLTGMLFFIFNIFGFDGFIYYYTAAVSLPTVLIVIYLADKKAIHLKLNASMLTGKLMRSMASVSFFGFLNTFSNLAIIRIDAIMVNHFIDSAATGIYVTSFYFGTLVQMPARALNRIAPVLIADAYKENDLATIKDIYKKSSLNLYIIALWLLLGLAVNLDNIYKIIPETYAQGRMIIIYIALANVVRLAGGSNDSIIAFSKYYKYTTLFLVIFLVLIFTFNLYFIPQKGITGAAIASLAAISIFQAIKVAFIYYKFGFQPFNWKFIHIAIAAAIVYLTADLLYPFPSFIMDIIMRSILITALYGGYIYFTDISPDINQSILQFISKVKNIFRR
jgi:O-antigen/teichoic acid export membrane protein